MTGSIRALSEPAGARVFLDGKERGATPLLIEGLKAGDYELRFELEGHDAQVARLALGAGEPASFSAALKANQGELVIRYQLASAADAGLVRAWLDGKDLGLSKYATHTVLRLPFGSHTIRVEAPGYAPAERTVLTSLREEAVVIKLARR
ncbi:MAG: PEGA domain-containing protein [Spirochaetaceae bacterium]|nr:PEGA domain-containing protein [Spirochaetaceae bacterium]